LSDVFGRHDQALTKLRGALVTAVAKVHETLDARQRKVLSELVEAGPCGSRRCLGAC
jgi:hypothetical protein